MGIANLNSIRWKIRRLTGSQDTLQLPDTADPLVTGSVGIDDYINSFYLYDLPAQFRSLQLKDKLSFNTIQGLDTYSFNTEQFTSVEAPCYCAKREIALFQSPWNFYGLNYNWQYQETLATGTGVFGATFTGTTKARPIIRSVNNTAATIATPGSIGVSPGTPAYPAMRVQNILITANTATSTLNVTDNGFGQLIGDCSAGGTVNYVTGVVAGLVFTSTVPSGNAITIQYCPVKESIPLSILFFQNQFTLRPVPDKGYSVEVTVYRQPSQALMLSPTTALGTPELLEWWELIAFGAAKKIYEDRLDSDGAALMDKALQERYQLTYTRTYAQLGKQRINTIFAEQNVSNMGSGFGLGGGLGF